MNSSSARPRAPEGSGSVSQAPNLPDGFTDTFTSRYVDTEDLRLHAVVGGEGPALLAATSPLSTAPAAMPLVRRCGQAAVRSLTGRRRRLEFWRAGGT